MAEKKEVTAAKATAKSAAKKNSVSLKDRISKFFREYKSELKKITWPTRKQVIENTILTLVFIAVLGVFIWLLDTGLVYLRDWIFSLVK